MFLEKTCLVELLGEEYAGHVASPLVTMVEAFSYQFYLHFTWTDDGFEWHPLKTINPWPNVMGPIKVG